jgi:capsular polysaccharide biosynthesis protein
MKSLTKNMPLILTILILVLAFYVYNSFFRSDAIFTADPSVQIIGADIVSTYNNLQSVNLDQKLFESKGYTNLTDFGSVLSTQPIGRTDPFDQIGR